MWIRFEGKSDRTTHFSWKEFAGYGPLTAMAEAGKLKSYDLFWTNKAKNDLVHITGFYEAYIHTSGLLIDSRTNPEMVQTIVRFHQSQERVKISYGDGFILQMVTGRIVKNSGVIPVPVVMHNSRSTSGIPLWDYMIVKIESTKTPKRKSK